MADAERTPYGCRPVALVHTLRNLIENDVRCGKRARVKLGKTAHDQAIAIEDRM